MPSRRVTGETREDTERAMREFVKNPEWVERILEDAEHVPGGTREPGVRNALLTAYLDREGHRQRRPLHELLNLPQGQIASSITISMGSVASSRKEAQEWSAAGWKTFKVKLGGPDDEAVIRMLRSEFRDHPLYVDANEAWDYDTAKARIGFLERAGVALIEQPLPRDQLAASGRLADEFDTPILLDEAVLNSTDVLEASRLEAADGINIKLTKCGGPYEARRMVKVARDAGWKVMMGCMIESQLGLATAAAFAGVLDYADLDGDALLTNDPFQGFRATHGVIRTPSGPGVGSTRNPGGARLDPIDA